jgi:hypothetical protein
MSDTALYLYAIAAAGAPAPCAAPILADAPVAALREAGLTALVSRVPAAAFAGPGAEANDPAWVAGRAAAHHGVVSALHATGVCLPLGFGTLFGSVAALADWLTPRAPAAREALARLEGQAEWVLRLSADLPALTALVLANDAALRAAAAEADAASPGRAVLLRKRLARNALSEARGRLESLASAQRGHLATLGAAPADEPFATGFTHAWRCLHSIGAPPIALVHSAIAAHAAVTAHLAGPYPPYGFARSVLEAA